jgi:hypothetical protein
MKSSIALSALILAVAAGVGWYNNQRLVAVRENQAKLVATATKLGIVLDPSPSTDSKRATKRGRESGQENSKINAEATASDLIAMAKEIEVLKKQGELTDVAAHRRLQKDLDRVMLLDAAQLKTFLAALGTAENLTAESRRGIIESCFGRLAQEHPETALILCTESADLVGDQRRTQHFSYMALSAWARQEPASSMAWVRKNEQKFPKLITEDFKITTARGIANSDPQLALKSIAELNIKDSTRAVFDIAYAARSPASRTANLAAIRDHIGSLPDEKSRGEATMNAMGGLAHSLETEGYAAATQWIAGEKFSPAELGKLTEAFHDFRKSDGAGAWIDWMGANLPTGNSVGHIDKLVRKWTKDDYQAAGKWLATTPASPTKNTAVRSYAETVSQYDPAVAIQWAMTLPPGPDRDATLKHIQDKNPAQK